MNVTKMYHVFTPLDYIAHYYFFLLYAFLLLEWCTSKTGFGVRRTGTWGYTPADISRNLHWIFSTRRISFH